MIPVKSANVANRNFNVNVANRSFNVNVDKSSFNVNVANRSFNVNINMMVSNTLTHLAHESHFLLA